MAEAEYYRGGKSVKPMPHELRFDPLTGLLRTTHGISVFDRRDNLDRFGGPYRVTALPGSLKVIQSGRDPHHFEIVPTRPMTLVEFEEALDSLVLVPA
jgi:hypothetical protein